MKAENRESASALRASADEGAASEAGEKVSLVPSELVSSEIERVEGMVTN